MRRILMSGIGLMAIAAALPTAAMAEDNSSIIVTAPITTPLEQPTGLDKLGTPIGDLPRSIQIVPRVLIDQQGATQVRDILRNVSGLTQGGQFAFGFYDRFIIRGLNTTFLNDGLPDGTSDLSGYVHSLTGVQQVEVLKGPGSALFGSAEPGGTINLVHYRPTDELSYNISEQYGSYQTTTTRASLNTPTGIAGLDARIDGQYQHSAGFRGQRNETGEIFASLGAHPTNHNLLLRFEYHHLENRPDAIGLPFTPPAGTGLPLNVPQSFRYYTPFAYANQDIKRIFASDAWTLSDHFTINLRTAYTDRDLDLARNAGGRLTAAGTTYSLTGRQLRQQSDRIHDFVFQAEPTWKFDAGNFPVMLLAGAEARKIDATTQRATADLPNIANIFAPVTPETSISQLSFLCNTAHSCNNAELNARFYGVYGVAQIALGNLKLRVSGRQNWFFTEAEGRAAIPANPGSEHPCTPPQATSCPFVPGQPVSRHDNRFNWDAGAVYGVTNGLSIFAGYSTTAYPIFNSEEPQSIGQTPETGTQLEGGIRAQVKSWLSLSTSIFRTSRNNVYTILLVPNPNGVGSLDQAQIYSYRTKGWETDLNLKPLQQWTINANLTLQSPKLTSYPQTPALVGNRVPSTPKRLANVWTTYDIPLASEFGSLELSAGMRYKSREYGDAAQTRILPSATQFDLAAGILHKGWVLRAGVNNVTDKINWDYAAGAGSGAIPGQGRTFFVSLGFGGGSK